MPKCVMCGRYWKEHFKICPACGWKTYDASNPVVWERKITREEQLVKCRTIEEQNRARIRAEYAEKQKASIPQYQPKCPTCGSHRYRRITNTKRALSFLTWGLASDKIGKQFECMDCGYKW